MNIKFEKDLMLPLLEANKLLYEDDLKGLSGYKLAIDANVLLRKAAKSADPIKVIQEGGASIDLTLQKKLVEIIRKFQHEFNISLLVVVDGMIPKHVIK